MEFWPYYLTGPAATTEDPPIRATGMDDPHIVWWSASLHRVALTAIRPDGTAVPLPERQQWPHVVVSTVFLVLNHGTREEPLHFETMVCVQDNFLDPSTRRTRTHQDALAAHQAIVERCCALVQAGIDTARWDDVFGEMP